MKMLMKIPAIAFFTVAFYTSIIQAQQAFPNNPVGENHIINEMMSEPIANTLYGHSFASPSSLYTINNITGVATLVGSIGYSNITDVAFRDNVLYGVTFNSFVSIDPATGVGELVGPLGYGDMNALAVSDSGVFYATSTNGTFISVDEEIGKGLYIGNFGSGIGSSGDMAFAKDGTLYASITRTGFTTDWLATINLQSGQASPILDLGYSGVYGLSLLNDELYGVTTTGLVLHIDIVSEIVSEIGSTGINFGGLTTSPDAIPLLELPYDYTGRTFVDESRDSDIIGGRVSSYFDHKYPTYCELPNTGGCSSTDHTAVNFHGYDGGNLAHQPPYRMAYNGHDGIDFAFPGSDPVQVLAAASGEVIALGYDSNAGNYVTVQHSGGYVTKYYHLESFAPDLHDGSILTRTTISDLNAYIGIMGSTGNSTKVHIHFMVENSEGIVVDPYGWKPKTDSAWYGENDPWAEYNANPPEPKEPKDASSHYLWLHPLENTRVVLPNTTTQMNSPSNDVSLTFFSGAYTSPLRAEFSEVLNPVLFNGTVTGHSFYVMAYVDDIVPVDILNNEILIKYVVPQQIRSIVSIDSKFVVWNTASANWQTLPTEWNSTTGVISTMSSQLGTFALVNPSKIYLPAILSKAQNPIADQIAFAGDYDGDREIYIMDVENSELVKLTNNNNKDESPSWSPDGSQIVFHSNRLGYNQIYIMNADGGDQQRLITSPYIDEWPYWSPSGDKIAFARVADHDNNGNYNSEVFVINMDDHSINRLTFTTGSTNGYSHGCWPSGWSSSGSQILFYCYINGTDKLWIMNADGTNQEYLLDDHHWNAIPSMSPNGQDVVFATFRDGNYEIYKMNLNTLTPIRLTNSPSEDWRPVWSENGLKILFESKRDGTTQIYWMNSDGSDPKRLSNNMAYAGQAVWRPKP